MNKDLYLLFQSTRNLYEQYGYFFQHKTAPSTNLNDYLKCCGYEPNKEPFLTVFSNIGAYSLNMLDKYKDQFLFHCAPEKESGAFVDLCFNIKPHMHLWIKVSNIPEDGSKVARYVCIPCLFSINPNDNNDFIKDNESLLILPTNNDKFVGFKHS